MRLKIENALESGELARVRELILSANWADGRLTAGSQSGAVKNNRQLPEDSVQAQEARQIVSQALARNPRFITAALPKTVFPPLFNSYSGSQNSFGNHIDNAVRTHAASARHVRTDISCTLFLSPPDSYDGGELVVQASDGEQRIKLAAGDLMLYSGSSVHRVEPVTRGERLACFFWIESMIRQDDQRQLLFDMDMAITSLRQKDMNAGQPEGEEVIQLTGSYHNLLRMWAHV
ncbi:PKHD-type hydroxylase [Polaromonas vacuolata]|uniref:PKHD-type hydroxylase n=1 Tax=Polaromonas vacuolata TaxID=37448 RepID=A0A6H2H8R0_9BURK|nr:Fe2+-dependent dioxygenase [Polaromonas vacuolata]QJC56258.1 PKHD-type hydroxylase [Polaromonas vacuolata]